MSTSQKFVALLAVVLLLTLPAWAGGQQAGEPQTGAVPAAVFPVTNYVFDPVVDGSEVVYDFQVRNTGGALLEIRSVRTG